jgi:hypothetical protein
MVSKPNHNSRLRIVLIAAAAVLVSLLAAPLALAAPAQQGGAGLLTIYCDTGNVQPGEIVGCHLTIDGLLQPDIIPGQPATFALTGGTHAVHIELTGAQAGLWDPAVADYSVSVPSGGTKNLHAVFNKKGLLTIKLNKANVVGDLYVDGVVVALQASSAQISLSSNQWHRIEAKNLTDPAAQGAYRWKDTSSQLYLYPAQQKTLTLSLFKQYLMGFLNLRCKVTGASATDDVLCNVASDNQTVGTIAPNKTGVFNLPPGSHAITVTLTGASATGWEGSKSLKVSISVGVTSYNSVTFKKSDNPAPPAAPQVPYTGTYSGFGANARQIFLKGQSLGRNPNRFDKVGDSDTDTPVFLEQFDKKFYDLREYAYLDPMITYFAGSFWHTSYAAHGGFVASSVLDPQWSNPNFCKKGETPLACEYRTYNPSVAIIMLRTYPVPWGDTQRNKYESDMRTVIEYTIKQGIVPVVSTVPMITTSPGELNEMNSILRKLAAEYDVPLWDMFATTATMPGFAVDYHNHLTIPPDGYTTFFDETHLAFGMTHRNLEALEVLHLLYTTVMQ